MIDKDKSKVKKSEIFGWCLFDFANSSYATIIITAIYPTFFVSYIAPSGKGDFLWGIATAIAHVFVVILSPLIGVLSDIQKNKKKYLVITTLICVFFTGLLYFPGKGMVFWSILFVAISFTAFSLTENLISSFLPEIAPPQKMGKISGYGWAFGYVGGILSLFICVIIMEKLQFPLGVKISMPVTALFFLIPSFITFILLKEKKSGFRDFEKKKHIFRRAYRRLSETLRNTQENKNLFRFLFSFFLFSCGISIAITFSAIYAQEELGFGMRELLVLIIGINLLASIGAFSFGFLQDKIGAKKTVIITLIIWCVSVAGILFSRTKGSFYLCGSLIGIALGSTQSSSRALVWILTHEDRSGEDFGLWGFAGKIAFIVGSISYGFTAYISQSRRIAVVITLAFFIAGLITALRIQIIPKKI